MASAMIHIAVMNEINKELKRDSSKVLLGSIAPDISKLVGESKKYTHFLSDDTTDVPSIDKFLNLYGNNLNDDFVLGYYIHLYTDYLWFKYFLPEIYDEDKGIIYKLDGSSYKVDKSMTLKFIYNDYTNINDELIKKYKLDLSFLYDELPVINHIIIEAHMDKIDLIREVNRKIYENSKIKKNYTFNMDMIDDFIKLSVELIISNLKELKIMI